MEQSFDVGNVTALQVCDGDMVQGSALPWPSLRRIGTRSNKMSCSVLRSSTLQGD